MRPLPMLPLPFPLPGPARRWGAALALLAVTVAVPAAAQTTPFPTKPVRLVAAFAPGGSVDATARLLAGPLGEAWGQSVVVENKPGADGNIAAEQIIASPPDGYTLLITSNSLVITPALRKLPFDPINDLKPIVRILSIPNFLVVNASLPVRSVPELVEYAKQRPGQLAYGSAGTGSINFLGMTLLSNATGIRMNHVPYKGTGLSVLAVVSNEISLILGDLNSTTPHIRSGRLRAIGVTSPTRSPLMPDVPTIAEQGVPGFETATWIAIYAPARTPAAVADKLYRDIGAVLGTAPIQERLRGMGATPTGEGLERVTEIMRANIARWTKLVRDNNIRDQ